MKSELESAWKEKMDSAVRSVSSPNVNSRHTVKIPLPKIDMPAVALATPRSVCAFASC
jgi:hypothetical protein